MSKQRPVAPPSTALLKRFLVAVLQYEAVGKPPMVLDPTTIRAATNYRMMVNAPTPEGQQLMAYDLAVLVKYLKDRPAHSTLWATYLVRHILRDLAAREAQANGD